MKQMQEEHAEVNKRWMDSTSPFCIKSDKINRGDTFFNQGHPF